MCAQATAARRSCAPSRAKCSPSKNHRKSSTGSSRSCAASPLSKSGFKPSVMKPHRPRKRFGQHFLHDGNVIDRIVAAIAPVRDDVIIEIGPGEGVLTAPLLESGARGIAVELDRDMASYLPRRQGAPAGLEVLPSDSLRVEPASLASGPVRVVGNLPYNISTPVLFHLFAGSADIVDMHFMLQKEVVERLVASPGSRQYGRLSVMARSEERRVGKGRRYGGVSDQ